MKVALICFSLTGQQTGERLCRGLQAAGLTAELDKKSKYLPDSIQISTSAWAGEKFLVSDALIFIGATGIAVRSIAPYVASKKSDPAVLVVDECGKFVISLLSGHLGGANELALKTAEILEAIPVVTTATDLHRRFAVDVFAKKNNCNIFNMKAAKEVSAALLAGKKVGFYSEFPTDGELPEGLVRCDEYGNPVNSTDDRSEEETQKSSDFDGTGTDCTNIDCGVAVTVHTSCNPFISTTQVVPKYLTLGMGCRKDKDARGIAEAAQKVLDRSGFHKEAFEQIASIDLKKEEKGILSLSQDWQIPFVTYTEEELKYCINSAYDEKFDTKLIAPLVSAGNGNFLELFHGKTIAFKDMALSILPYLLKTAAKKNGVEEKIVILTATSGDTGKAALEGFADVEGTKIIVFYPEDGVSDVQKMQMVTQKGANTCVAAIKGNFDDAQSAVKRIFTDNELKAELKKNGYVFSSANSINIGRLAPQIVYYFYAYAQMVKAGKINMGDEINFTVPTGNFGNIRRFLCKEYGSSC